MVRKQRRILLVEDMPNWQANLRHMLEGEGYCVEIVGSYGEARTELHSKKYDLAIVDLRLRSTKEDNVEGMKVIAEAYRRGIRSIVVTGYPSEELVDQAFQEYNAFFQRGCSCLRLYQHSPVYDYQHANPSL